MANLGNTIINGALRVNGKINSSDVISAPSFVGALTGNANTATKLATARTINGVSFDGSANITVADSTKLPLAGGTLTGNISYNMNGSTQIPFKVYGGDANGQGISVGAGGATIVGSGESAKACESILAATTETLWLASDNDMAFITNCQTIGNRVSVNLSTSREFYPNVNNTGTLGKSNYKWNNVYATTFTGNLSGNASTASKLQTARNIAVTGSVSGNANFDGSANINISVNRKGATVGQSGSTNTKPWYKAASLSQKSGNNDNHIMFSVYSTYADRSTKVGILKIHLRTTGDGKWSSSEIVWLSKSNDISVSDFVLAHNTNVNPTVVELWCKCNQGYQGYNFDVISEGYRVGRNFEWTMYNTWTVGSQDAPTNGYTQQTSTLLTLANPISGNAATATKLQTARTIGVSGVTGTAQSFNGTANIVIPITAVPSTLLTNKSAIKGSEITNDKHWIPSSDASVTNFVSMTAEEYAANASSLATGTIVAITDGVEGYVTTQATSLTCDLPLDL